MNHFLHLLKIQLIIEHFKLFIKGSCYRGIGSQLYYMFAALINQRKFKFLNQGLGTNQIAVTSQHIINIDSNDYFAWRYFTDIDIDMVQEMQAFIKVTQNKNCLIDIGASIGIFSLVFSNRQNAMAWAIEPCESAYKKLLNYQKLNPKCQFQPLQLAIGNTNGILKMQYNQTNMLVASSQNEKCFDNNYEVNVITLDELIEKYQIIPDVIKVDVEGFELNVLQGATKVLQNYNPIIFLEVHPMYLTKFGSNLQMLLEILQNYNYQLYSYNLNLIKKPLSFLSKKIQRIICIKTLI